VKRNAVIALLASLLALNMVSPAIGGPSITVQVKTLKKRVDRLVKHDTRTVGRVDGLAAWSVLHDTVTTTAQSTLLTSIGNHLYSGTVTCGIFGTATGGSVSVEGGFSSGILHTHRAPSSPYITSTGYAEGETGTKIVASRPFGNGWQGTVYHDGQFPLTAKVYVMCAKLN
jgi:hypothetical protein